MRTSFRIEPLAALLAGLIVASALPAAAAESKGQIFQQRAADGRIVLTDRPSATAVTERTWQVDREDPAAAQQRGQDVRREAEAVSERVQRRIEAQERLVVAEQERAWQAQREMKLARAEDDRYVGGYIGGAPYPYKPFTYERRPPFFELGQQPGKRTHPPSRPGRVKGSAWPGSR